MHRGVEIRLGFRLVLLGFRFGFGYIGTGPSISGFGYPILVSFICFTSRNSIVSVASLLYRPG